MTRLSVRDLLIYSVLALAMLVGMTAPGDAESLAGKTFRACDDILEWPPYIYFQRENGKRTDAVVGYTAEVIREIIESRGAKVVIDLMPWRRCLREVEKGDPYQILLDASYNAERAERYHVSEAYYSITPYYFYSRKHRPDGLPIKSRDDLKRYRINGIAGYNYADYGLSREDLEAVVDGHEALIQKLHAGRCDLFPEWFEVMRGFTEMGKPYLDDKDLGYAQVPGTPLTPFHFMFPKDETGLQLKKIVDEGIREMKASGRLAELLARYTE